MRVIIVIIQHFDTYINFHPSYVTKGVGANNIDTPYAWGTTETFGKT